MAPASASLQPLLRALEKGAGIIVEGTVRRLKAATMKQVPVTEGTTVFAVDVIHHGPPSLAGFEGKDITIQFDEKQPVKVGERLLVAARSWMYGESLAVVEVARGKATAAAKGAPMAAAEAVAKSAAKALAKRIDAADLVIAGRVTGTKLVAKKPRLSEHDPQWTEATIEVQSSEKGRAGAKTLKVLFPASDDVAWHDAPKYRASQEGVWLLQKAAKTGLAKGAFTALHPLDYQPAHELESVRKQMPKSAKRK